MRLYWLGWEVPDDVPTAHMAETWPAGMRGWCTGSGDDFLTWVGAVWARDGDHAWQIVESCYGPSAARIRDRDMTGERDPSRPLSDRFPGGLPPCPTPQGPTDAGGE